MQDIIHAGSSYTHGGDAYPYAKKAGLNPQHLMDFSVNVNALGAPGQLEILLQKAYSDITRYPDIHYTCLSEQIQRYCKWQDRQFQYHRQLQYHRQTAGGLTGQNWQAADSSAESVHDPISFSADRHSLYTDDRADKDDKADRDIQDGTDACHPSRFPAVIPGNGASEIIYLYFQYHQFEKVLIPAPTFSEYARAAQIAGSRVKHIKMSETDGFCIDPEVLISCLKKDKSLKCLVLCNPNNPTSALIPREMLQFLITQA